MTKVFISYFLYLSISNFQENIFPDQKRRGPGGDCVLCKEYRCNLQNTFGLIGRTTAMTS